MHITALTKQIDKFNLQQHKNLMKTYINIAILCAIDCNLLLSNRLQAVWKFHPPWHVCGQAMTTYTHSTICITNMHLFTQKYNIIA